MAPAMKNASTIIAGSLLVAFCVSEPRSNIEKYSREAMEFCIDEAENLSTELLTPDYDRVYVYARARGAWLYFSHGDSGTFGDRSVDYNVLLVCAVQDGPPMNIVFMGQPLQDPVIDDPDRNNFVSPEESTEVLFRRENGSIEYCCSQQFDSTNILRNNPDLIEPGL